MGFIVRLYLKEGCDEEEEGVGEMRERRRKQEKKRKRQRDEKSKDKREREEKEIQRFSLHFCCRISFPLDKNGGYRFSSRIQDFATQVVVDVSITRHGIPPIEQALSPTRKLLPQICFCTILSIL